MTRLVFGCGYLGARVAGQWLAAGHAVFAATRSAERARLLEQDGLRPIVADVTRPETLRELPTAETVLFAIGYDRRASASRRAVQVDGLRAVLDALPAPPARILYISSTGVYGQSDAAWVDEDSPCRPTREAGQVLLAAEQLLAQHPQGSRAIILRLAGLYGPGRIPRAVDLPTGRPIPVPSHGHLNLIHVDDAAAVVLAAELHAQPPRTYLVADGHPVARREFYTYLAGLLGLPRPQFVEPPPDDPAALRARADKRVNNARMLAELRVTLAYPTYREGLRAIVSGVNLPATAGLWFPGPR